MDKKKLIQLIHIGKSKLAMDDETYRQMLTGLCAKASTRDMNEYQLKRVLDGLKKRGFKVAGTGNNRPPVADDLPQVRKILAMWQQMHRQGIVRDPSDKALNAWIKTATGIDNVRWLEPPQASRIIEKLKKWQARCCPGRA